MPDRIAVTSADFVRNIGHWQTLALEYPISITHHGRERLVLVSSRRYQTIKPEGLEEGELDWVLSNIAEGYVLQTRHMDIVRANAAAASLFDLTPQQMVGRKLKDLLPAAGAVAFNERVKTVIRSRQAEIFDGEGVAFGDKSLSFKIAPLAERIVVLISNRTERVRLEQQNKIGDAVCQALAGLPAIAGVRLNLFGRINEAGDRFQAISGFSAADLNDVHLTDIIAREQRRGFTERFERALGSNTTQTMMTTLLRKAGDALPAAASIAAVSQDGQAAGAVAMFDFSASQIS